MRRREFIMLIGGLIGTRPFQAIAQEAGRTYRVGMLFPFPRDTREGVGVITAFFDELRKQGFIEGQNLAIEYRAWAPHVDQTTAYAAELVKGQPDVMAVGGPWRCERLNTRPKQFPSWRSRTTWSAREW